MGSFNVSCGLTGLTIHDNDNVAFIPLESNTTGSRLNDLGKFFVYPTDLYNTYLPPIFGTYADYGDITNIQDSETTRFIENHFDISADQFITCIFNYDRNIYSPYSPIRQTYPNNVVDSEGLDLDDYMDYLGFAVTGDGSYTFHDWSISVNKDDSWTVTSLVTGKEIIVRRGEYDNMMESFALQTGALPGFDEDHWDAIMTLNSLHGMYVHADALDELSARRSEYLFDSPEENTMYRETLPAELSQIIDNQKDDGRIEYSELMMTNSIHLQGFIDRHPGMMDALHDRGMIIYPEFLRSEEIHGMMREFNRMFTPGVCGPQFGNDEATRVLGEVVADISQKNINEMAQH